jgi:peptide/nickel transport system substrate-binding protein
MRSRLSVKGYRAALLALATALVLGALGGTAGAASAGSQAGSTATLRIGSSSFYSTLDPAHTEICDTVFCSLMFDTLMNITNGGQLAPGLATSISRPGGGVYVFHLRHGVRFWDGSELTAADVANAINYLRYPKSQTAPDFTFVKSVAAPGKYTVVATLRKVFSPAIRSLGQVPVWEKRFQDAHKTTFGQPGTLVMGSGPWEVKSFDPTSGAEFTANPHYWAGKVNFGHVSVKFFSTENSEALAFRAGEIDATGWPPIGDARAFASTCACHVLTIPAFTIMDDFVMNPHIAPWNDVHVRRAVAYAINRAAIVSANGGASSPAYYMIPPQSLQTLAGAGEVKTALRSVPIYSYSVAKAKAEIARSSHPNGFSDTVELPNYGAFPNIMQVIQSELAAIGIKLTLNVVPIPKWLQMILGPKTFGATLNGDGWNSPDPSSFMGLFGSGTSLNCADYDPPGIDKLIAAGTRIQDPKKRTAVYAALLKRIGDDVPYIPLLTADYNVVLSDRYTWPGANPYSNSQHWELQLQSKR